MWGNSFRQRLRLLPLYGALRLGNAWPSLPSRRRRSSAMPHGLSVIIPERDAPDLLERALDSLEAAIARISLPSQVVVVVNGAPQSRYRELAQRHPQVEWIHHEDPLGFSAAILAGLARARYAWSFLMNNDMVLAEDALELLQACCGDDIFAIGCEIEQRGRTGRREETGFTDWHRDDQGVHLFHAEPGDRGQACEHLCASGGAAMFRTEPLRDYARDTLAFDPFYWEDVDWSLRAWRDGWRVLFHPKARAWHRHRATVSRFYSPAQIERIASRNALLVEARHVPGDAGALMQRICDTPYETQRELSGISHAWDVFRLRRGAARATRPTPPIELTREGAAIVAPQASYCYRLASPVQDRPRLLLVTPYGVFPPRHGGGRRVAELVRILKRDHQVILLTDEAAHHDCRAFVDFDGLLAVHLVQRPDTAATNGESDLSARMRSHCHAGLRAALDEAMTRFAPQLVQVEHAELAPLVTQRREGQQWILSLHDAFERADFGDDARACEFETQILARYDAVVACSREDVAMISHPRVACVPNGARKPAAYRPSSSRQLLFMGPFRYARNVEGIRRFLHEAFPAIREAVPDTRLLVLGGDEAAQVVNGEAIFRQQGVELLAHREDVPELLDASALTINPLQGIRGSAVKLVESLMAGRVCVSTREGARGFQDVDLAGLVAVEDVASMAQPIVALLRESGERHRREVPADALAAFSWEECAARQKELYRSLLARGA